MQSKCNVLLNPAVSVLDSRACGRKIKSYSYYIGYWFLL